MIKYQWFRYLKMIMGYSIFIKTDDNGTSYLVVRGDRNFIEYIQEKFPDFKQEY